MKFGKIEVDSILSSILPRLFKDRFLPETRSNLLEIDFFLTDLSPPSAGNWTRDRSGQSWADFWKGVIDHREAREMAVVRARGSGTTPGSGEQLRGKKLEPVRGKKFLICGIIKGDGAKSITDSTPLSENREFHLASIRPCHGSYIYTYTHARLILSTFSLWTGVGYRWINNRRLFEYE